MWDDIKWDITLFLLRPDMGWERGMFTAFLFLDFILVYQSLDNNPSRAHDAEREASHK